MKGKIQGQNLPKGGGGKVKGCGTQKATSGPKKPGGGKRLNGSNR